ncbi:hypothetical protein HKD37_19G053362 [Glycine soja]
MVSCMHSLGHSACIMQRIDVVNANNTLKHGLRNPNERCTLELTCISKAHWELVVLCPMQDVVVWFCSLHKKPDIHIKAAINSAMHKLKTTLHGDTKQAEPKWIEVKSHLKTGGYECGYYMWNIVSGELKTNWTMWFGDGTPLDKETMTIIHKKWATYFLKHKEMQCKKA